MTSSTCARHLARLLVIWPNRGANDDDLDALVAVYTDALADLTDAEMEHACLVASRGQFFPTPYDLRTIARPPRPVVPADATGMNDLLTIQRRNQEASGVLMLPERATGQTTQAERSEKWQRFWSAHKHRLAANLVNGTGDEPTSITRQRRKRDHAARAEAELLAAQAPARMRAAADRAPGGAS